MPPTIVTAQEIPGAAPARAGVAQTPEEIAFEVVTVLGRMSFEERVRSYRSRLFDAHELALAAARRPEEVPILNDEYEWIAINAE
jgi:hypothetical protein